METKNSSSSQAANDTTICMGSDLTTGNMLAEITDSLELTAIQTALSIDVNSVEPAVPKTTMQLRRFFYLLHRKTSTVF